MINQIWVVADQHFAHSKVIELNNRPWKNVEEMNQGLIDNHNSVVGRNDMVYLNGDFAFKNHGYFINALKGKKVLVRGSHDKMPQCYYNQFQEVCDIKYFRALGHDWVIQHCCPRTWNKSHFASIALFAHAHGRLRTQNLSFDTGVDIVENNYTPQPLEVYVERAEKRLEQMIADGRLYVDPRSKKQLLYSDDLAWALKKIKEGANPEDIINRFI